MLRCDLAGERTREGCRTVVARYATANPDLDWILGGGWSMEAFPGGCPTAADLDDVAGGRPVYLPNRDHHSAWVSSRALELAGIDRDTPDPVDGRIERDAGGRPTGALHEGAMALVERLLPPDEPRTWSAGDCCGRRPICIRSASPPGRTRSWGLLRLRGLVRRLHELGGHGRLTARVAGAMWWERHVVAGQIEGSSGCGRGLRRPDRFWATRSRSCRTASARPSQPPCCARTSTRGHATGNCGLSFVDPEALTDYVTRSTRADSRSTSTPSVTGPCGRRSTPSSRRGAANGASGPASSRRPLAGGASRGPDALRRLGRRGQLSAALGVRGQADDGVDGAVSRAGAGGDAVPDRSLLARRAAARLRERLAGFEPGPARGAARGGEPHAGCRARTWPTIPFLPDERIDLAAAHRRLHARQRLRQPSRRRDRLHLDRQARRLVVLDRNLFDVDLADGGVAGAEVVLTLVDGAKVYEAPSP